MDSPVLASICATVSMRHHALMWQAFPRQAAFQIMRTQDHIDDLGQEMFLHIVRIRAATIGAMQADEATLVRVCLAHKVLDPQ